MDIYFPAEKSMIHRTGGSVIPALKAVAGRYTGQNPAWPLRWRAFSKAGIRRQSNYRYDLNLEERFPDAPLESVAYAWAQIHSEAEGRWNSHIGGYGPFEVFVNGVSVLKSNILNERFEQHLTPFSAPVRAGANTVVIRFIRTVTGFGGVIGGPSKYHAQTVWMPSSDRQGQEGWLFTEPMPAQLDLLPVAGMAEAETGCRWLPDVQWPEEMMKLNPVERLFRKSAGHGVMAWTQLEVSVRGTGRLTGKAAGNLRIWLDGCCLGSFGAGAPVEIPLALMPGTHALVVTGTCGDNAMGWQLTVALPEGAESILPGRAAGTGETWMYLGPLFAGQLESPVPSLEEPVCGPEGEVYWRLDQPETWVRPYCETPLFARWNYPLGVTLYGLLSAGTETGDAALVDYVRSHVAWCVRMDRYAFWDKAQYGAASVNPLQTETDCLDDCGSFGSVMLETAAVTGLQGVDIPGARIAEFMMKAHHRTEKGAFVRINPQNKVSDQTLWADDLYMSIPFLCRWYIRTGETAALEEAITQVLLFREYLFRPGADIMSHVYDAFRGMATETSWGRGNGWVAFSLTELLAVMPEEHPQRQAVLEMFRTLCRGYLRLQDAEGMWHQVLDDARSYQETSCTAMFIYAFARGVRFGWLENEEAFRLSAVRGWQGISRIALDAEGNVYGVCRGSGFSFTKDYYMNDLSWNLNDTHGIGIVLLAGIEVLRMHAQPGKEVSNASHMPSGQL